VTSSRKGGLTARLFLTFTHITHQEVGSEAPSL